ncbi:MAG: class I SAM-dependent methyltransferase [Spirochaetales bacterium]|jgi:methylase of polypeptide subunit release factors|nr:class I SAM-dependent methyltransferase [Spirochaetales bacterium]
MGRYEEISEKVGFYEMQGRRYFDIYGFESEAEFVVFLKKRKVIFDAGCGLGYKAVWFSELAPEALVIGMDFLVKARQGAYS